jgi:glycosyltransferase involved in cell wall biosynthesis
MRIGVNVLHQASGGSLTTLIRLLRNWDGIGGLDRHQWILFCSGNAAARLRQGVEPEVLGKLELVIFPRSDRGLAGRFFDEQFRLPAAAKQYRLDVLFCPANVMPYRLSIPAVVMFQNIAPFCESVTIRSTGLLPWLRLKLLGRFIAASAGRAPCLIFISKYVRDLFVERFGVDLRRAHVLPHGTLILDAAPDPELERRLGIRRPFLLSVSHLNPYKNIVELIEGFRLATADDPSRQLVIAGAAHYAGYLEKIEVARRRAGADRIVITGELPHADTLKLMAACETFVFTSTCESCPNSVLEAQSLGVPIASSNVGVMPEISGDAAVYFDPFDPQDIARALRQLMHDPALRDDLRRRSTAHIAAWPTSPEIARERLRAIEECAGATPAGAKNS